MADFWSNIATADLRSEANVEHRFIIPLLYALGYENEDIESKYPVIFQEGRPGRRPEADFVCFYGPLHNRDTSLLVVEAKRPGEALPDGKAQGESYAANLRAPLLLLTNAEVLEIWQLQASQESVRVLNISVSSMVSERGKIEQLLGKAAVYDYCRTFHFKSILEASGDYGRFETAELTRTSRYEASIGRTLRRAVDTEHGASFGSDRLRAEYPSGAIVVAPSGYGKTTLSRRLLRQAIEEHWRANRPLVPFDVPLPDLEQSKDSIVEFMHKRLSAHCPNVTLNALTTMLRDVGATILCDGFDRATAPYRRKLTTEFANIIRDYPRVQLFVLSRTASKPDISLPLLELAPLSDDEVRELEKVILGDGRSDYFSIVGMMSTTLRSLCVNPLLLRLTLRYWEQHENFPQKIEFLFRSWLDSVLETEPNDHVSTAQREQALTVLSQATSDSPIASSEAISLLKNNDIPSTVLNELIGCDAVHAGGSVIEVQHEALADYLRAKAMSSIGDDAFLSFLKDLSMPADSFFPVLLMAQLRTRRLQSALWKRLSEVSVHVYLDALRYRFDVSKELEQLDPERLSEDYLDSLIEGIEIPLAGFFAELSEAVLENITDDAKATLAATGFVTAYPGTLTYKLHARGPDEARVSVASPTFPGTLRGVNLDLSRYRIDSARLLGMTLLRSTIFEAVKHQQLKGGPAWAAERLIGRVRYLAEAYGLDVHLTDSLDKLDNLLKPHADAWMDDGAFSSGERFSIQSLLDDIATLRAAKKTELDPWWLRLGWDDAATLQDEDVMRRVLDEEYRRVQIVYTEIVRATFPAIADQINSFTALPIRWKLAVLRRDRRVGSSTVYYHWLPVALWDEAGADVTFTDGGVLFPDGKEVIEALTKLNRPAARVSRFAGFQQLSSYDGMQWNGHFDGATTVTHEVCSLLKDELKLVFDALPHSDGAF